MEEKKINNTTEVDTTKIVPNRKEINRGWTWYIFVIANFLIVLGVAITWIVFSVEGTNIQLAFLPTLICNLCSLLIIGLFIFFENKQISPKIHHFQKKWLKFYIISMLVYFIAFILSIVSFLLVSIGGLKPNVAADASMITTIYIIFFSLVAVISAISTGIYRYARFKIDLDLYRRKRGVVVVEETKALEEKKQRQSLEKEEYEKIKESSEKTSHHPSQTSASSGLFDIAKENDSE